MLFPERRAVLPVLGYWFAGDEDAQRARFELTLQSHPSLAHDLEDWAPAMVRHAMQGHLDSAANKPYGRVALTILLDVTPRMLWRGKPAAYEGDLAAQAHAMQAIASGQDRRLSVIERFYLYQPLMHAEDEQLQDRSVKEYERLHRMASGHDKEVARTLLHLAHEHKAMIDQFGRFPDRNPVLHRMSTSAERLFMSQTDKVWFAPQPVLGVELSGTDHMVAVEH